jgi:hypothetical protein
MVIIMLSSILRTMLAAAFIARMALAANAAEIFSRIAGLLLDLSGNGIIALTGNKEGNADRHESDAAFEHGVMHGEHYFRKCGRMVIEGEGAGAKHGPFGPRALARKPGSFPPSKALHSAT